MKKMLFLLTALCFVLSACIPAALKSQPTSPAPVIPDIQSTVAVQVEQTIQSLPTPTLAPSNTPVVITATSAPTQTQPSPTPTVTQNPAQQTPSATPGTGTLAAATAGSSTPNPGVSVTPTETSHYQYYGTMPPDVPSGNISLLNMSRRDAYISLQCTTTEGYTTVVEYPVSGSTVNARIPAGQYYYVAWVGGKEFTGNFKLGKSQDRKILLYKDRVEIK